MNAIYVYEDEHIGKNYIVIPKIREFQKALGSIVITFDNGDRRTLEVADANKTIQQITEMIEAYYARFQV